MNATEAQHDILDGSHDLTMEGGREAERSALTKLTIPEIKSKLEDFGINGTNRKEVKRMRKAALIDLLLTKMKNEENEDGAGKSMLQCLLLY